jgi:septum formation inhibitor-activating ATPase MinD
MKNATNDLISFQPQETEVTVNMSSDQLFAYQERVLADQDKGLETLSAIIGNQKRIATTIGNEVERQNVMIDSMGKHKRLEKRVFLMLLLVVFKRCLLKGDRMEQLNDRLLDQTYKIKFIDRKSTTCGKS